MIQSCGPMISTVLMRAFTGGVSDNELLYAIEIQVLVSLASCGWACCKIDIELRYNPKLENGPSRQFKLYLEYKKQEARSNVPQVLYQTLGISTPLLLLSSFVALYETLKSPPYVPS